MKHKSTVPISWEYLMPKKKERMAGYIRFSDPSMPLDDATMDSQAKAIRLYAEKEGYIYEPKHEYREAISAYTVPYRDNTYMRLQRGKRDRLENGNINGHNKPAYGYIFIDTEREVKAAYAI